MKTMNTPTIPKPPSPLIRTDPELSLLSKEAAKRGYGRHRMGVVYTYAWQQRINGDPAYSGRRFYKTMLRRVIAGDYDHLFN